MKTIILYVFVICVSVNAAFAQNKIASDGLTGTWLVEDGSAKVKIEKNNGKYFGKIVWLNPPTDNGKQWLDTKNPDKSLQSRPQMGLALLQDFTQDGEDYWSGGTIYDPDSGKIYSCHITKKDNNTIEVRGYVGISLFGRTETWKRSENVSTN